MGTQGRERVGRSGRLGRWLLVIGLAAVTGLSGCCTPHVIDPPRCDLVLACRGIPKDARDHVHIFIVHGADPLDWANIEGVRTYLAELGFCQTHLAQFWHLTQAIDDVKQVHREDPDAHFVLIGFSLGANMVSTITRCVKDDGIAIDLLVYCGGNSLMNKPRDQPDNAKHIVNILATGWFFNGAQMDRAENVTEPDVFHFGSPSHPRTMAMLLHHLTALASVSPHQQVTYVEPPPPEPDPSPHPELLPPPPPVQQARDEWDYLKPNTQLAALPPDPNPKPQLMQRKGLFNGKTLALILSGKADQPYPPPTTNDPGR